MKNRYLLVLLVVTIQVTSACDPLPWYELHLGNLRRSDQENKYVIDVFPGEDEVFSEINSFVLDISTQQVEELGDTVPIANPCHSFDDADDNITLSASKNRIDWIVRNSTSDYVINKSINIEWNEDYYYKGPISFISYDLNMAYLIFRNYSETFGIESIGYVASLDTGATDNIDLQDWDENYLNFTRSYDKQNIIYVAAECCVCYGGTYYKLTDSGIIGITTDYEKSILIGVERFISLGERYYSVETWDIDTLEYNNWTIKQEDIVNITQSVVPVEMLTLMAPLLIISISYFLKRKVGKSTIKH